MRIKRASSSVMLMLRLQVWPCQFTDPLMAFALKCTVQLAKLKGWSKVVFEYDAKNVIGVINNTAR